jgi:hypothetical protein
MLAKQAEATFQAPSSIIGLVQGSYEAYCLDQAVWFVGATIQNELEKAGHKRQKGEGNIISARRRVLAKYLGEAEQKQQFADPAALFN